MADALIAHELPPTVRGPKLFTGIAFLLAQRRLIAHLQGRHGAAFTVTFPALGPTVVVSDPALLKQVFTAGTDTLGNMQPNLGRVMGPGSIFSLDGEAHRRRRKLLVPPFHGRRMKSYEGLIVEETLREMATWPVGQRFETLTPFMRITLNIILRAVFGAEGEELQELRELMPEAVERGSRLTFFPVGPEGIGPWKPWNRFLELRRRYDAVVERMIEKTLADPHLDQRDDVLAMMLQSRYDDGAAMTHQEISDELTSLLAAGHETTATTLAWAVERLRRHPGLLDRLVAEVDQGGSELMQATVLEVQRTRPVIIATARKVVGEEFRLGSWSVPKGYSVLTSIELSHLNESVFPAAREFDPDRFVGVHPDTYAWIPFGGGTRRCVGAAFANLEMTLVLRTLLREFTLRSTDEADERWRSRGVAHAPARGGQAIVDRRIPAPS